MDDQSSEHVDVDELNSLFPANNQSDDDARNRGSQDQIESESTSDALDLEPPQDDPEKLLDQVEADLASVVESDFNGQQSETAVTSDPTVESYQFQELEKEKIDEAIDYGTNIQAIRNVELDVSIELGRAEMLIEDVLKLKQGSVLPLDKLAGDPVDILANGRLVARGEVVVLNDHFCVRVCEILTPEF